MLMTRLIKGFKLKNKRVVAVKRAPDKYYLEPESKDTFKFMEAGADEVCLVAEKQMLTMHRIDDAAEALDTLETQYPDCDFLLLEGLRRDDIPLIEIYDATKNDSPKFPLSGLSAIISNEPVTGSANIPRFGPDDIDQIINFMEAYHE